MYIDKLDDIVNKYNNTYHSATKMKAVGVKSNTYIDSSKEINDRDPKFKLSDIIRISKYKIISAKGYNPNWSQEVFVIRKVKITGEEIVGTFYETELQKANQKEFRIEKVINKKGDQLYVKWK